MLKYKFAALLTAIALPALAAHAGKDRPEIFKPAGDVIISAMADNGLYAASISMGDTEVDNPVPAGGTFIDLSTNTAVPISAPGGWAGIGDIADDGMVVGECAGKPATWSPATDKWTTYDVPKPWAGGTFMAVTPDGKTAVGYFREPNNEYNVHPMAYDLATGKQIELSNLPAVDLAGEDKRQNVFYGISPDGRYALGQMSESYLLPVSLMSYVYDLQEHTWRAIGYSYDGATKKYTPKVHGLHFIQTQYMSCDGQWVTGSAYMVLNGGEIDGGSEFNAPYRYNVATDELEIFTAAADQGMAGNKIAPDGTLLTCAPIGNPYPTAYVRSGNFFISLDQILAQVYGMRLADCIGDNVTGSFNCLSADGLTAAMITYDNCYVIRMPEPFADAAAKVDLLSNYLPSIASGTEMSKISEITLSFDREISATGDRAAAELVGEDGEVVRNSSGFQVATANPNQLVITFRTTTLEPGKKYAVRIPAEAVWLKDDPSIKSKEITLRYTGRKEGAVSVRSISPASGSALSQLNGNPDYITVRFDASVAVTPDAKCVLYNADDGSEVASLLCAAVGNEAYFYPASAYYLYKGTNYRVVISEGSVTDISGSGPNAEITIDYVGTYVRELSADDTYIFNANCNSYNYFLMHKTEVHQPAAIPESWGFTSDNMWMLTRDSEQTEDWAMTAHSMFAPAAQSDDWLVTPQLYIPDANSYLAFDAQSYLKSKADVLKVYVYCDDAVHNYLSDAIVEDMRAQGSLVVDEQLSPGASEEGLAGDWTHYTVPLADFAGKNIYVAFVNHNYDQSAIFLDNIQVVRDLSFVITNQTPAVVVDKKDTIVKGMLSVVSEVAEFDGLAFRLLDFEGVLVDEIIDPAAKLKYGDTYSFQFAEPLELESGWINEYTIEVESGANVYAYNYTIKDLAFEPVKRVVLEEFTGKECGNCPLGIRAIENLQQLYPDNFIAVTMRTYGSDPLGSGLSGYSNFLGLTAAPSGRVNRGPILFPVLQNGAAGYTFYGRGIVQSDGTEAYLWADAVQDALKEPAEAEVEFAVDYDAATGKVSLPCNVRFAVSTDERSINLFAVLVEDQMAAVQSNYMYQESDPLLGEWGAGGQYARPTVRDWKADDVTRYSLSGEAYGGVSMGRSLFYADVKYPYTISATVPEGRITDPANCKVVVMLIDGATQKVINAAEAKLLSAGIADVEADDDAQPIYYNLQGMLLDNPTPGTVCIRRKGAKVEKVIIK